ncbi:tetratricopeptide repeat protein [Georgenia faecalis]|uniref:tetratricopeptide repeat protein n=1 Tax=Georgenia faecalis TaxID=2483799 RepID=UPI000FDC000B|nr:tetratricopeptide repeat protein [Georgenia faecalis]
MSQPPSHLNLHGAVDLSSLARPAAPAGGGAPGPAGARGPASAPTGAGGAIDAPVVVDVTQETFAETVQLSTQVPVVLVLGASWAEPSTQLGDLLERLAGEYGGRFQLGRVDVEANPQIAAAFQVQSVPTAVAVIGGQPVPLFQGVYPEAQVRQVLDELLRVAAQSGVAGVVSGAVEEVEEAPEEPPLPPLHAEALDAIDRGDLPAAADAYRRAIEENPADEEAKAALGQVELMIRASADDPAAVVAAADAAPATDVAAQLAAADVEIASGQASAGLERVLRVVRATRDEDRETARLRLLELFEVVGPTAPEVMTARRALASALY